MIFALVGNQNCGKTTLFNALTGSNQHVGNFPGVTVDQKMGEIRGERGCSVVDLPGIYSLRPYTQEEIVSRDFIINQKPDGIINIVDATNIERNLYLTLQLLELQVPMVLALNMMDEVRANGGTIDVQKMSQALGIPVIPISAANGEGVSELVDQAIIYLPRIMETDPPNVVEQAIVPTHKSSPSYSKNVMMGGMIFVVLYCAILTIRFLMNDTLVTPDDIERNFGVQPLATIPEGNLGSFNRVASNKKKKKGSKK